MKSAGELDRAESKSWSRTVRKAVMEPNRVEICQIPVDPNPGQDKKRIKKRERKWNFL